MAPNEDEGGDAPLVPLRPGAGRLAIVDQAPAVPRERADAARNRERILKAARRLLRRRAMDSICMDTIAEEAGVGKGTLYRRFPDRAALVHALLDEDTRRLQDRALAGFDLGPTASSVEQALVLLGELFDFNLDHAPLLCAANAKGARYDHPAYAWQRTLLAGHLREAVRRFEIAPLDPLVTAQLMLSGVAPDLLHWLASEVEEARAKTAILEAWRRALR